MTKLRICDEHWKRFEKDIPGAALALVSDVTAGIMLSYADGNKFQWDYYTFEKAVAINSGGCPVCFIGETLYSGVINKMTELGHLSAPTH